MLSPGIYVLEVLEAKSINVFRPQVALTLQVAAGECRGFAFSEYLNCNSDEGVRPNTKAWKLFEVCLNRDISLGDELDSDSLIGRKFEARVLIRPSGKGNYAEFGSMAPYRPEKVEPDNESESEGPSDPDADDFWD